MMVGNNTYFDFMHTRRKDTFANFSSAGNASALL